MYRFVIKQLVEDPNKIIINDREIINKLTKVLRKKVGDTFVIFDYDANEYDVKIVEINKTNIICQSFARNFTNRELETEIHLYQALLKSSKLELVVQKATEIGIRKIVPMVSENCVVKSLSQNKTNRLKKIVSEATMQCGGKNIPEIGELINISQAVSEMSGGFCGFIAHEKEQQNKLYNIVKECKKICLMIGPEGGFTSEEILAAKRYSFIPFSLSKRILRAETAAIVACGIIANL